MTIRGNVDSPTHVVPRHLEPVDSKRLTDLRPELQGFLKLLLRGGMRPVLLKPVSDIVVLDCLELGNHQRRDTLFSGGGNKSTTTTSRNQAYTPSFRT